MGNLFGPSQHKETRSTKFSPKVTAVQEKFADAAAKGIEPFVDDPSYKVAPLNDTQNASGSVFKRLMGEAGNGQTLSAARSMMGDNVDYSSGAISTIGRNIPNIGNNYSAAHAGMVRAGERAVEPSSKFSKIDSGSVLDLGNPYREDRKNSALKRLSEGHDKILADIAGSKARGAAFRGSGGAIRKAQADKNLLSGIEDAVSNIDHESYQVGAQLAGANQNSENQAIDRLVNTALRSADMGANALTRADSAQSSYFNRGLASNNFDLNAVTTADGLTTSAQSRDLRLLDMIDRLENSKTNRGLTTAGANMGWGDKQQLQTQTQNDSNYTQFMRLANLVPQEQGTTVSTQPIYRDPLGMALGAVSAFSGF